MKKYLLILAAVLFGALAIASPKLIAYMSTPSNIKTPAFEHYHLRAQVIVDGRYVDFSKDEFQRDYDGNTCSAEVSEEPFDFHDNTDQFVHVHWDGMTGGQLLKYYGLNVIGGDDGNLGNIYSDGVLSPKTIEIYGDYIPEPAASSNYYVYVGEQNNYEQKSWDEFLNQDLEKFFGKKSNLSKDEQASLIEQVFFPSVYAHGDVIDGHSDESNKNEDELKRINNLIGNVVIFAQETQPTDEQIRERFNDLVPLHDSTCGG